MPTHTFSTIAFKLFSFVNGKNHVFRSYSSQVLYGALLNMTMKPPICTEKPRSIDFTLKRNYTSCHEKAIYSLQIFKFYFRDYLSVFARLSYNFPGVTVPQTNRDEIDSK